MSTSTEPNSPKINMTLDADDTSGVTIMNMGPQHPSTHGVLRMILTMDGERILKAEPDIGYLHTGIEKTAEGKTYLQALTVTDRMDYLAPLNNNLGFSLAVEKLLGITVPERVDHIRVLLVELQRIASHMVWLGTSGLDAGAMSMFLYCFQERENILDLFEAVSGVRMMTSFIQPGGLMADLNPSFLDDTTKVLDRLDTQMQMYYDLLEENPIWMDRTKGIGVLTKEMARDYCITGPTARASGVDRDLRKNRPYCSYPDYEFSVPLRQSGDSYDRYMVRMEEMEQAIKICRQAVKKIPPPGIGVPYRTDDRKIVPPPKYEIQYSMESLINHFKLWTTGFAPLPGDVYQAVEGPRGEVGFHMTSDGSNKPYRMRVRTPSFTNVQVLPELVKGALLADVVVALSSVDFVLGDCDR